MESHPLPQRENHWDSEKFDTQIDLAYKAPDLGVLVQLLRGALSIVEREAPPGTITAGKLHFEPIWGKVLPNWIDTRGPLGLSFGPINIEDLRRFLDEHKDMPADEGIRQFAHDPSSESPHPD